MTNQTLFELMSEIDFDLIERAEAPVPLRKKPVFRVAMAAAVIALLLSVSTLTLTVAGAVAGVQAVRYVENNYPEYDGTVLHFAQIFLTEDENVISSLLDQNTKNALGGFIAALRNDSNDNEESIGEQETETPEEQTEKPEEETGDKVGQDTEETTETETESESTEPEESTTHAPVPPTIVVHPSYDHLYMIAGDREIEVFSEYASWNSKVNVTDPEVTHLRLYGWMAFGHTTPGTYGYSIDRGERVFDPSFSQEADGTVNAVSKHMGGKSCSRMEVLIPIADLAPGSHRVSICVKSVEGKEVEALIFTVVMPDGGDETETEPEITDEEPEDGWSEGLQYDMKSQNGETVYVVSGIGTCKDTDVYIPPTYRGYPVVAIDKEAFFSVLIDFVSVPSTVKEIGEYAFFDCSVKRVELSEGVEVIGDSAFADAYYLEEINFPSTLKTIGPYAFCATDLTQVILPDSVTEVYGHAFTSCLRVTEIKLSANLTEIKAYMLEGVHNVKSIELPRGVERIGEWAFMQCSRLETVTLYNGVLQIDDNIFEYCEEIKEIRFVGTQEEWESIDMSRKTREQLTPLVVYVEE